MLIHAAGLYAPRLRDGRLHDAHHPLPQQYPPQDLYVSPAALAPRCDLLTPVSSFLSENAVVASIMYAMKITFIFILVLFIDSVQRVYRVQLELAIATEKIANGGYVSPPTNE